MYFPFTDGLIQHPWSNPAAMSFSSFKFEASPFNKSGLPAPSPYTPRDFLAHLAFDTYCFKTPLRTSLNPTTPIPFHSRGSNHALVKMSFSHRNCCRNRSTESPGTSNSQTYWQFCLNDLKPFLHPHPTIHCLPYYVQHPLAYTRYVMEIPI